MRAHRHLSLRLCGGQRISSHPKVGSEIKRSNQMSHPTSPEVFFPRSLFLWAGLTVTGVGCKQQILRPDGGSFPGEVQSSPDDHRLLGNYCLGALRSLCVPAVAQCENGAYNL